MMTETEWAVIISDCRSSGISPKRWCENHGYKYTVYCYWNRKLNKQKQQWGQIVSKPELVKTEEIKLQCGKLVIAVGEGFSPKLLADILQVVNSVCY
jgi:hypothetical protein